MHGHFYLDRGIVGQLILVQGGAGMPAPLLSKDLDEQIRPTIQLDELVIECFFPADEATERAATGS